MLAYSFSILARVEEHSIIMPVGNGRDAIDRDALDRDALERDGLGGMPPPEVTGAAQ